MILFYSIGGSLHFSQARVVELLNPSALARTHYSTLPHPQDECAPDASRHDTIFFQLRDTARPPFSRHETLFGSECQVLPKQLFLLFVRPWCMYPATFEKLLKRVSFADPPSLIRNRIPMICEAELQPSRESFAEPVSRTLGNHSPGGQ
jgi:hypothetical protein